MTINQSLGFVFSMLGVFLSVAMLLRSLFFLLTAYARLTKGTYYTLSFSLICGIFHIFYNYDKIVLSKTNFLFIIFIFGTSIVFYLYAKNNKDVQYSISELARNAYSLVETSVINSFMSDSKELEEIQYADLMTLEYDKPYTNKGVIYIRRKTKFEGLFFETIMAPGSGMNLQVHPGCVEYCLVIEGVMKDTTSGKTYREGKWAVWNEDEPHTPINKSLSQKLIVHVYFKETL